MGGTAEPEFPEVVTCEEEVFQFYYDKENGVNLIYSAYCDEEKKYNCVLKSTNGDIDKYSNNQRLTGNDDPLVTCAFWKKGDGNYSCEIKSKTPDPEKELRGYVSFFPGSVGFKITPSNP